MFTATVFVFLFLFLFSVIGFRHPRSFFCPCGNRRDGERGFCGAEWNGKWKFVVFFPPGAGRPGHQCSYFPIQGPTTTPVFFFFFFFFPPWGVFLVGWVGCWGLSVGEFCFLLGGRKRDGYMLTCSKQASRQRTVGLTYTHTHIHTQHNVTALFAQEALFGGGEEGRMRKGKAGRGANVVVFWVCWRNVALRKKKSRRSQGEGRWRTVFPFSARRLEPRFRKRGLARASVYRSHCRVNPRSLPNRASCLPRPILWIFYAWSDGGVGSAWNTYAESFPLYAATQSLVIINPKVPPQTKKEKKHLNPKEPKKPAVSLRHHL